MSQMYTLKVNIRAQEEREKREKERQTREAISKIQPSNATPPKPRKRKGLNFHEPGTFIAQGEQLRKKAKLEALQKKIAATAARTGIADAAKLATLTTNKVIETKTNTLAKLEEEEVPEIEWWDKPILGNKSTLDQIMPRLVQQNVRPEEIFHGITNLIEHPPIKRPPGPDTTIAQVPIFLTKKERKKLRRQNRKNLELEKQEKIKLGLLPKPEPKLKRSNIMYALGDEAITNPSLAEKMVREQEEKRLQAHLDHNQSKKVSFKEKKMKKINKIQEDLRVNGIWVALYRVINFDNRAPKPKIIEKTAKQQPTMTGVLILYKDINLAVVEGASSQQKEFKRLMLRARNQKEKQDPLVVTEDGSDDAGDVNRCFLVWEGQVSERAFKFFEVKQVKDELEARKYFRDFNVEHYWDLAFKMSILESIDDT